jgi:sentrin-specific protease 1
MIEKEHKPISIDEHQYHDLNNESGLEDENEDDDFDFDDNDSKGSFALKMIHEDDSKNEDVEEVKTQVEQLHEISRSKVIIKQKQPLQQSDITDVNYWYNLNRTEQNLEKIVVYSSTVDFPLSKFLCLRERHWLNDEPINYYMNLLSKHYNNNPLNALSYHYYPSFFFTKLYFDNTDYKYIGVKKWSKKVNVFKQDKLFFPIHKNSHWTLAVIFMLKKEIRYYDSMMGDNSNNGMGIIIFDSLLLWMKDVHTNFIWSEELKQNVDRSAITTPPVDWTQWRLVNTNINDVPQQVGSNDCGVFTIMFADFISNNINLKNAFNQTDINHFRMMIAASIIKNRLIYA